MENYSKGENVVIEAEFNIPGCSDATSRLEIFPSTKLRDIISVALDTLKTENQILWVGSGPAVLKVVSSAEVVKKRMKNLHQITSLACKRVEEYWQPKLEGLDRLKVTREVPAIAILLSKDVLDSSALGYQAPGSTGEELWTNETQKTRKKRTSNTSKIHKNRTSDKHGASGASSEYKNQNWKNGLKSDSSGRQNERRNYRESKANKGKQEKNAENERKIQSKEAKNTSVLENSEE